METFTANSGGTTGLDSLWSWPERLDVLEFEDRIEMIFKETSMITSTIWPSLPPATRVFKIVFSCKDGKWHKSNRIYGKIIPSQEERYEFED